MKTYITINVYPETRKALRRVAAARDLQLCQLVERLALDALKELAVEEREQQTLCDEDCVHADIAS